MDTDVGGSTFLYFAYGSNMLTTRIADRCPSAKRITSAYAKDHELVFEKRSVDKSGKATLVRAKGNNCPGVIFEINATERAALEEFEGPGYVRNESFPVIRADGTAGTVATYLAQEVAAGLKPYDWYLALILAGCEEHELDVGHIAKLRQIETLTDPNPTRKTSQAALQALTRSGITDFKTLLRAGATKDGRAIIAADTA